MEKQVHISHSLPQTHDIKPQNSGFSKVAVAPRINGPAQQWFPYGDDRYFFKTDIISTLLHSKATDETKW